MSILNAAGWFPLLWLILCYSNFTSTITCLKKRKQGSEKQLQPIIYYYPCSLFDKYLCVKSLPWQFLPFPWPSLALTSPHRAAVVQSLPAPMGPACPHLPAPTGPPHLSSSACLSCSASFSLNCSSFLSKDFMRSLHSSHSEKRQTRLPQWKAGHAAVVTAYRAGARSIPRTKLSPVPGPRQGFPHLYSSVS